MNKNNLDKKRRSPIRLFNLTLILVFVLSLAAPGGALAQTDTETPAPSDTPVVVADTPTPTETLVPASTNTPAPTQTNTLVPAAATPTNTVVVAPTNTVAPTPAKGGALGAPPSNPRMRDSTRTLIACAGTYANPCNLYAQPFYFQWDDNGSTDYYLEVYTANPVSYVNSYWYPNSGSCSGGICVGMSMATFPENTIVKWTVRGRNDTTTTAAYFFQVLSNKPTLYSPNESSTNITIGSRPNFCWDPPPSGTYAGTYQLYLEGPSGTVVESQMGLDGATYCGGVCPNGGGGTCSVQATNELIQTGTYTWHIVLDNGIVSLAKMFYSTSGGAPDNAVQVTPADGASDVSPTPIFTWKKAARATTYALVIQNALTRAEVLKKIYKATDADCPSAGTECTTVVPPATLNPGQYLWFVESRNASGKGFYTPWSFRVVTQAGKKPVTVSPSGNVNLGTSFRANYIWYRATGTPDPTYTLVVYGPNMNKTYNVSADPAFSCPATETTCSYRPTDLLTQDATYTWWIKANYGSTYGEVTSDPKTFKVVGASVKPDAVVLISPGKSESVTVCDDSIGECDVSANAVSFQWNWETNGRAAAYLLAVQSEATGQYVIWKWYMSDDPECTTTGGNTCNTNSPASDSRLFKLTPGRYKWRVDSWNSAGQTPSIVWTTRAITASGASPQLVSPIGAQSALPDMCPTYTWGRIDGATSYEITVYGSGLSWSDTYTAAQLDCDAAEDNYCRLQEACSTDPAVGPPILQSNKDYTWKVRATAPTASAWSSTATFKLVPPLPAQVTLVNPGNGTNTTVKPQFRWTKDLTASHYLLAVFDSVGTTILWKWYSPEEALCGNRVFDYNTCQVDSPIILGGGLYTWRVDSYNSNGQTPSKTWSFTVVPGPGKKPVLVAPSNNASVTTDSPTFQWTDPNAPLATEYFLLIKNKSTGAQVFYRQFTNADVCGGANCSVTLPAKLANGWYTWQVSASDGGTGQTPSEVWNFEVTFSGDFPIHLLRPTGTTNLRYERYEFEIIDTGAVSPTDTFVLHIDGPNGSVWDGVYAGAAICPGGGTLCAIDASTGVGVPELYLGAYSWWIEDTTTSKQSNTVLHNVTVQIPEQTTLVYPLNADSPVNNSNPKFQWQRRASATWYLLVVYNSSGTAVVYQWMTQDTAGCPKSGDTCYSYPSASGKSLANGTYTWRVDTYNAAGQVPSASETFTVATPPETPVLLNPTNSSSIAAPYTPTLEWEKPAVLPSNYKIYLTYIQDSVEYNVSGYPVVVTAAAACGGATCQYMLPTALTKTGKWHYWVIGSRTSSTETLSAKWRFYVPYP